MTAIWRTKPFGKLLRVREADDRAIFELLDNRTLWPAGRSNAELTNGKSKSMAALVRGRKPTARCRVDR